MDKLIEQVRMFPGRMIGERLSRFADGQHPEIMFITCSDSRIVPALITGSRPGQMFELRNAGNIVRPYDARIPSAESGTIEYAMRVLDVSDLILCGHSHCGAVGALTRSEEDLAALPAVRSWLRGSGSLRAVIASGASHDPSVAEAGQRHLLTQYAHLMTHPGVRQRVDENRLRLHAWFYEVHTGAVLAYRDGAFTPL